MSRTCTLKVALSVHKCLIRLFILSISVLVSYASHLLFLNPIHEDSATYPISTSSLIMEVEAVTHALRRIASRDESRTTHAILLTDSMSLLQKVRSGMGYSPDCNVKTPAGHGHAPACEAYEGK